LDVILPKLADMGVEVLLVTSAVRVIPAAWNDLPNLYLAVSIDGLQPDHDRRRAPATYDRILKHIEGHRIFVHCTITRQLLQRPGYLREFAEFWSKRLEVRRIWFSLYTPQEGEQSAERLTPQDRASVIEELSHLRLSFPLMELGDRVLAGFRHPPESPQQCLFAQATACLSADLATRISPCQFGGRPVCRECGCVASAGLASFSSYRVAGLVQIGELFSLSRRLGEQWAAFADRDATAQLQVGDGRLTMD
jgi:hypothetical protein